MLLYNDCPLENPSFEWTIDISSAGPKPPVQNPPLPPVIYNFKISVEIDVSI